MPFNLLVICLVCTYVSMCVCRYVYEEPRAKNSVNNKVLTILGATIVTSRNSYKDNIQVEYNLQKG